MGVILTETHNQTLKQVRRACYRFNFFIAILVLTLALCFNPFTSTENVSIIDPRFELIQILRNHPISVGTALDIAEILIEECERSEVPVNLVLAVLECESQFKPWATSRTGAKGLGQISPVVWSLYIKDKNLRDPRWAYTPALGVRVMIWFLGDLYRIYNDWDKVLRHYYQGSSKLSKHSDGYLRAVFQKKGYYRW